MAVLKTDVKILKYIHRHPSVSRNRLCTKYSSRRVDQLSLKGYIRHDYTFPKDEDGFPIKNIPDSAAYTLTDSGLFELERLQWFNGQFIIAQLLIPIIVGVASAVITAWILSS